MGTTPNYSLPYPEAGDQPKGDVQIKALADAVDTTVKAHADDTTDVHGITATADLETKAGAQTKATAAKTGAEATAAAALSAHESDTTAVHGIPDTALLETQAGATSKVSAHAALTTNVHGITNTANLETQAGAQTKATAAQNAAISDAATKYLPLAGGTVTGNLTVNGALNAAGVTDWINVKAHGALGDGTTNDTAAIQAALNATPMGGICFMPFGDYRTNAPLIVPPGVTLMGEHANLMASPPPPVPALSDPPCRIKPLPTFAGASVILFVDEVTGGYPKLSAEQRLVDIMIDGSGQTTPAVDGIQAKGNIQNIVMRGVTIRYMSGNGIYTDIANTRFPYSWRLYRVMSDNNKGHGFFFNVMTDITMFDCQSIGNAANGFQLNNCANSQLSLCRAEWNGNYGFNFTGNWGNGWGSGALVASACSTDRNGWDGVHFDCLGTPPFVFNGLMLRRDGRNNNAGGGGYAALSVDAATTTPLVITGLTVFPGTDDGGAGTNSPEIGVKIAGAASVVLDDAFIHAAVTPVANTGTKVQMGPSITAATGLTSAPVAATSPNWGWASTATATGPLVTSNVFSTKLPGDAFPRSVTQANGVRVLGSGAVAPDTPLWSRGSAGNMKAESFVDLAAGGQAGGSFTSWNNTAKALIAGSAGGGLAIAQGANARMGESVLVAGAVTVPNTSVTATTRIFLSRRLVGGAPGHLGYTRTAGTSFGITSSSNTDTSTVTWLLIEPA